MATTYYCDPLTGSLKGDGSKVRPWGSLQSIVPKLAKWPVRSGDTIRLLTGLHGSVSLQPTTLTDITIAAVDGHKPVLNRFVGTAVKNWTFRNLLFRPTNPLPQYSILFRVNTSAGITVDGCDLRSCDDISELKTEDWTTKVPFYAVSINGTDCKAINNTIYACAGGILLSGDGLDVSDNAIECFANDGIVASASNLSILRNRIVDQYQIPGSTNHNDAIQLVNSTDTVRENVTISDNYIARSTGKYKSIQSVSKVDASALQGIGQFDGKWKKVKVINNIVLVTAYNGIVLCGTEDSTVSNNTVVSQSDALSRISFRDAKDGRATVGGVCENNIAPVYLMPRSGVRFKDNFSFEKPISIWNAPDCRVISPEKTFTKFDRQNAQFDLSIRDDSPAAGKVIRVGGAGAQQ